jgi:general secretion pathway protein B
VSFILDALKKSEGERQRQSGPAMFEVRVAPPKTRVPLWAAIVGGLLLLNLAIVAWVVMRRPAQTETVAATSQPSQPAPAAAPAPAPAVAAEYAPPPVEAAPEAPLPAYEPEADEPLLADEPALDDPVAIETPRPRSRVTRGTGLGIPTYDQLGGQPGPGLPELRLDLHVYAERPGDRFVFVNNRRLREGEALPDGTRVESIVPEGVVIFARNQRFLLQRE